MAPPGLQPECPRGHPVGTSPDRRHVAVGLVIVGLPFLLGVAGSVMIAEEALGPMITLAVWVTLFVVRAVRAKAGVTVVEWIAIVGCLLVLQLLLDLHTSYLGDLVIAGAHAAVLIALAIGWLRRRRPR